MESTTYIKYIKISPKKLRFSAGAVRKMKPADALKKLTLSSTRSHKILYKVIKSAIAAAVINLKSEADLLEFKLLAVEEAPSLKRMRPGGRGMARLYKKYFSHVKIILTASKKK